MSRKWYHDSVTYQIYIRSFADSNSDGIGDINGIRNHLHYINELGADAIWITPFYESPQKDNGYDVSDYFKVHHEYGTLDDVQSLIHECHELGIRFIMDIVPNHTSSEHIWFKQALNSKPHSKERDRYIFRDKPNNWTSIFGGSAWKQTDDGQYFLHLFSEHQPDLNWRNPEVQEYFKEVLRFWLDRGVDGFRIDVAHGLIKHKSFADVDAESELLSCNKTPYWDQDEVHEIYRQWRQLLNSYGDDKVLIAEAWVHDPVRLSNYVRPDELTHAFNFDFLSNQWNSRQFYNTILRSLRTMSTVGAPCSWVINNHDVVRSIDRYDLNLPPTGTTTLERLGDGSKINYKRGLNRSLSVMMLMMALPGDVYIYQGEELGIPEVRDIPEDRLLDPIWEQSNHRDRGRDGCRVPLPWNTDPSNAYGFSQHRSIDSCWIPISHWMKDFNVEYNMRNPHSVFHHYRKAIRTRKLIHSDITFISEHDDILEFKRGQFHCITNFGTCGYRLPESSRVLDTSAGIVINDIVAPDTTVWLIDKE